MQIGLILPAMPKGASAEGIEAAAEVAERLHWADVWTTDHLVVDRANAPQYGRIFEAIVTLAYLGGRTERVRLGTSVLVVPQRNAVVLAKEFASLDALTRGRVTVGVGVGWNRTEFANLGVAERFSVRGAYLEETIGLWRHLWAGRTDPFEGRFHRLEDFTFEPLPVQPGGPPIWIGARSEPALRRAGRLADTYHASQASPAEFQHRIPAIRAGAEAVGRPMPSLSARVQVRFGERPRGWYAIAGTPEAMAAEVRAFQALGVGHLAVGFGETDPERVVSAAVRFDRDVLARLAGSPRVEAATGS
jgi:probable F420-dependent oxidoreductase